MARGILRDLKGQQFGDWLVLSKSRKATEVVSRSVYWLCRCVCGVQREVRGTGLINGRSTGCGCRKNKNLSVRTTTHGYAGSRTYHIWQGIRQRCHNEKNTNYHNYGGRGIRVCERWLESFEHFLADVGECPSAKHSLDRFPDNDGNYEPGNVRWATRPQQLRNTRRNVRLTVSGRDVCVADLERFLGANRSDVMACVRRGMTGDEIVTHLHAFIWALPPHPCA